MASAIFFRALNPRSLINVNSNAVVKLSTTTQRFRKNSCSYATLPEELDEKLATNEKPQKKLSKAMKSYLERAKQYEEFMKKEQALYQIGKRHLANMMGENPETFNQDDIDKAIRYLFPSGLFEPKARPIMRPPEDIFPRQKEAVFDETGRPYHSMFYTFKPNYYEMLYNIAGQIQQLDKLEDIQIRKGILPEPQKVDLVGSNWVSDQDLEKILLERLNEKEYDYFLASMERLVDHPLSHHAKEFIFKYRNILKTNANTITFLPIEVDADGRQYVTVKNCMRKSARGEVTIRAHGTGKITINGKDITYFEEIAHREQCVIVEEQETKMVSMNSVTKLTFFNFSVQFLYSSTKVIRSLIYSPTN